MTVNKVPSTVHFKAPKNILWVRYAAIVGRMPVVVDVDMASSSSTSHAALTVGSSGSIATSSGPSTEARTFCRASPLSLLRE